MNVSATVGVQRLTRVVQTDAHGASVYAPGEDALHFTTRRPDVAIWAAVLDAAGPPA